MSKKIIQMDIFNETAEIKIETKGYVGTKCVEEAKFLKEALGEETEVDLKPVFYEKEKGKVRTFKPICG
jgi:hypothetical protein